MQEDVCNGCGYCVPACPFGVIDQREDDGRVWKCTLCYDRLKDDQEPACAQACPTDSIQFGELDELRERAEGGSSAAATPAQAEAAPLPGDDPTTASAARAPSSCCSTSPRSTGCRPTRSTPTRDLRLDLGGRGRGRGAALGARRASAAVARRRADEPAADGRQPRSYYGRPVIKQPLWTPEIPVLLLLRRPRRRLGRARAGWPSCAATTCSPAAPGPAALAGVGVSPALLISDLGRPGALPQHAARVQGDLADERRLVDPGGERHVDGAGRRQRAGRPRCPAGRGSARPAAALLGLPLVDLHGRAAVEHGRAGLARGPARAAVRVRRRAPRRARAPRAVLVTPVTDAAPARRLAIAGAVAELAPVRLMEQRLGELAEPYRQGPESRFEYAARGCRVAGASLLAARGAAARSGRRRPRRGLLLAGALSARFSVFKAGFGSARDPKYVVGPQRERVQRGERPGASRSTARTR